jgi:hypothetical protein
MTPEPPETTGGTSDRPGKDSRRLRKSPEAASGNQSEGAEEIRFPGVPTSPVETT